MIILIKDAMKQVTNHYYNFLTLIVIHQIY